MDREDAYLVLTVFQGKEGSAYNEALKVVKETFRKADKYKWHSLKDNPNDLPDVKRILFYTEPFGYYTGIYDNKKFYTDDMSGERINCFNLNEVIAWAYIPPFESEEK